MATSGGPAAPTSKREFTPEQKRQFAMLGVAGVLALIVGYMYVISPMLAGNTQTAIPAAPTTENLNLAGTVPTPVATGVAGGTPGLIAAPSSPTLPSAPVQGVLVAQYRPDPFAPFLVSAPPAVLPPPPVPIPPPIFIAPVNPADSVGPVLIPGSVPGQPLEPLKLPIVNIPRVNVGTQGPREVFPPSRQAGGDGTGGVSEPQPSYNKRLSGYLISERTGVRALLEITTGENVTTAVVRPGDEVEGVRVLSIQNTLVGGTNVVRMLVREANGQESYVDLKAAPQGTADGATGGGETRGGDRGRG